MEQTKEQKTTFIGKCNFRGNDRVFGIRTKDRRQHMYVIGQTGTGKSTLLKNLVLQDIQAGRGVAIIDPHGEFVEEVLEQIPTSRTNDVVYFNPVDGDYPIGFNVLEVADARYKHLVVSDLLGIFTKIWANVWSARMEYILQNCILALLDTPGTTLLGIPRILVDKDYREKIVAKVTDPVVRSFWMHEYETWRDQFRNEAIVPIQNKVGQFLNTSFIRNIVGQPTSSLNISQIMNEEKILLVNVSKGRVGEDNSQLLGAMVITKIQLSAMERVRILEEERRDFYLYVDEFQNFATDSFANILSEARKYRLNLTLAHQYIGQLVTDVSTKVRDAVFGNVGTLIAFRVGAPDAEFLETQFAPEFTQTDLISMPNHHIYLRLMVDGVTSRPFSSATLPPLKYETDPGVKEKVIKVSRERYARPRVEVEEKIARWSGMMEETGNTISTSGKMFDAKCWNCGKDTTVPFQPDGKRPVYCLNCFKQIEEGKLIPLPDRMPQERPSRFSTSLGILGIEFASSETSNAGGRESRPRIATRSSPPAPMRPPDSGRSIPQRPEIGARIAPTVRQDRRPPMGRPRETEHNSRQTPAVGQGNVPQKMRRDISVPRPPPLPEMPLKQSRPIVRVPADVKPVSLSKLQPRNQEQRVASASSAAQTRSASPGPIRPTVDLGGLKKALANALETRAEQAEKARQETPIIQEQREVTPVSNQATESSAPPSLAEQVSNGVGETPASNNNQKTQTGTVIKPGEAVRF